MNNLSAAHLVHSSGELFLRNFESEARVLAYLDLRRKVSKNCQSSPESVVGSSHYRSLSSIEKLLRNIEIFYRFIFLVTHYK